MSDAQTTYASALAAGRPSTSSFIALAHDIHAQTVDTLARFMVEQARAMGYALTTLGDWVKAAEPGARSYAVSGKDRAAITMAGQHADGVYWWFDGIGFTTSQFAGPSGPAVTTPANAFNKALFARWKASPPPLYPAASATCQAMEKPVHFGKIDLSGHKPYSAVESHHTGVVSLGSLYILMWGHTLIRL